MARTDRIMEEQLTKQEVRLSRFVSLVLRHKPEAAGLTLDAHGWADVDRLLAGAREAGRPMTRETLERIVLYNNKKRFAFSEDGKRIRARQGHSIEVDVELQQMQPPEILYHGTSQLTVPSIREKGICKMSRQYVHLSDTFETALAVGRRHGKPAVLLIDAAAMARDGIPFFRSENGVWLCEHVPPAYLRSTDRKQE